MKLKRIKPIRFTSAPADATPVQRRNFINVQIDAIGIGFASAAAPFLPVFLTRLGATNFQVGLLTSMPALTGLVMAVFVGRFLQSRRRVVPWFSAARLLAISSYALTGLVTLIIPPSERVNTVLLIWAIATLPQTLLAVAFSVVMNAVAGPRRRYELMSRRWSILGLTNAITVAIVGKVLDTMQFPINYQLVFIGLSLGGLVSYYFSSHIDLPERDLPAQTPGVSWRERVREYKALVLREKDFIKFVSQRFVFLSGVMLSVPLFPLYYVREVDASDAWIGAINTIQAAILLVGYFYWTRTSRLRGSRFVLIWTSLGLSFYPALVASTQRVELIAIISGFAAVFQAGLDLVFFDELMRTVPEEYSAVFVSLAQSFQYLSSFLAPLLGTWLASHIGIGGGLFVSAGLRFAGFALFAWGKGGEILRTVKVTEPIMNIKPRAEE